MTDERDKQQVKWVTVDRPGQFGKNRSEMEEDWNKKYGVGNWRVIMETAQGKSLSFEDIMGVFIDGYVVYFTEHPEEAGFITANYSYAYDKDELTREEAFDPYYFYEKPGFANQFHHTALNIALERELGIPFKGNKPLKVRLGKPSIPVEEWPDGWKWSPCFIPCTHPGEIPNVRIPNQWWKDGSIEDYYQRCKALQIKDG